MKYSKFYKQENFKVYSIQKFDIIEKLNNSENHYIPSLRDSAAYDEKLGNYAMLSHRCAYLWMIEQFKKRVNSYVEDGLFWLSFEKKIHNNIKKSEGIVILSVPKTEILVSLYENNWNNILYGYMWNGSNWIPNGNSSSNEFIEPTEEIKNSWEKIFDIPCNCPLKELQGVLVSVNPKWVSCI